MKTFVLMAIVVLTSTAGELLVTHGMKKVGEIDDFRPASLLRTMWRGIRCGWLVLGVAVLAASFFTLLAALSIADASFVIPATAVTYVLNTLGAGVFLRERVSAIRWAGAALVAAGVYLVSL